MIFWCSEIRAERIGTLGPTPCDPIRLFTYLLLASVQGEWGALCNDGLNQLYLVVAKALKATSGIDVGFRVDAMYGQRWKCGVASCNPTLWIRSGCWVTLPIAVWRFPKAGLA